MKQHKAPAVVVTVASLFLSLSSVGFATQSDAQADDQPAVVAAVGPVYPTIASFLNAKGDVVVEVKIDLKGKVVTASAVSGNEYLRKSSEKAAVQWQFVAVKEGSKERVARLTFTYRHADTAEPGRTNGEVTTVFMPPYRVEVILHSVIVN